MGAPNTITGAQKALEEAQARGAHTVRINVQVLEILLSGHALLGAVMKRSIEKMEQASDEG